MPVGVATSSRRSLLFIVQHFCRRTNLPVPLTVIGTTDPQVQQIYSLLEEVGIDMAGRGAWEGLINEATFVTVATESQGNIYTIATNGFRYLRNQTIWDRTSRLPGYGPLSGEDYQARKALAPTGPRYQYRVRGDLLMLNPAPTAGLTWAFEYVSKNWLLGADGGTYKEFFTLDTDTILLPETVVLMGLRAWWKKEKGFDYAEDFRMYESQCKDALGRDGSKAILSMAQDDMTPKPGVFVTQGSWLQ